MRLAIIALSVTLAGCAAAPGGPASVAPQPAPEVQPEVPAEHALQTLAPGQPPSNPAPVPDWQLADFAHVLADGVAREAPGDEAEGVMRVAAGDRYMVLDRRDEWLQLATEFEGLRAWIADSQADVRRGRAPDGVIEERQRAREAGAERRELLDAVETVRRTAELELVSVSKRVSSSGNYLLVDGVLLNRGSRTLSHLKAVVPFQTASGEFAGIEDSYAKDTDLRPGESTTFSIMRRLDIPGLTSSIPSFTESGDEIVWFHEGFLDALLESVE